MFKRAKSILLMTAFTFFLAGNLIAAVTITVDPECTRSIQGISELDRKVYFSLCDAGTGFEKRCKNEEVYDYLINDLGVTFGRRLGVVEGFVKWGNAVREDPQRPGYADIEYLKSHLQKNGYTPSEQFKADRGPNLNVAAHGNHNAYPKFMGEFTTKEVINDAKDGHPEWVPENIDAAAELAATVLKYGYSDFDRPAYFEPLNEGHWGFFGKQHFADWHMKTMHAVHEKTPNVKVGGFCMSVAYMYRNLYHVFRSFTRFIDNTNCDMDFYSFHVYDYYRWRDGNFAGRVTSGLPLEGVLDIMPNYTYNKYGKEIELVVSEQGGYVHDGSDEYDGATATLEIANKFFPGSGFEWEMKRRSIVEFIHVSTMIANTMGFMDHPHIVKKSVPFILMDAFGWDTKYYAVMYVPYEFKDKSRLVPTQQQNFYKLFKGVNGRRVKALCSDPDIQTRAFVDGSKLYLVMNNLANKKESVSIDMPDAKDLLIRRLGRKDDFTGYFKEEKITSAKTIEFAGREAVLLVADYGETIKNKQLVNEVPCYGDRVDVAIKEAQTFTVKVPDAEKLDYAQLRIGISRPAGTDKNIKVWFNEKPIKIPLETCVDRLEDQKKLTPSSWVDYSSCKIVSIPVNLVKKENKVKVDFVDDKPGSVGSVVLRAAVKKSN